MGMFTNYVSHIWGFLDPPFPICQRLSAIGLTSLPLLQRSSAYGRPPVPPLSLMSAFGGKITLDQFCDLFLTKIINLC